MTRTDRYANYRQLADRETEGRDYRRVLQPVTRSTIAIIAPHAGGIEPRTSGISRALARDTINLYLFEGIKPKGNRHLHITSRNFDEPACLGLIAGCDTVIAIHGCKAEDECIFLGGLDSRLKQEFASALDHARFRVETEGHKFIAVDADNICNRGRSGAGVQVEISGPLRRGKNIHVLIEAMRSVLMNKGERYNNALHSQPRLPGRIKTGAH